MRLAALLVIRNLLFLGLVAGLAAHLFRAALQGNQREEQSAGLARRRSSLEAVGFSAGRRPGETPARWEPGEKSPLPGEQPPAVPRPCIR